MQTASSAPDEDETNPFARSVAACQVLEAMLICSNKNATSGTAAVTLTTTWLSL